MTGKTNHILQEVFNVAEKNSKDNKRRRYVPSKRAKGYTADRKAKGNTYGPQEGKIHTEYKAR